MSLDHLAAGVDPSLRSLPGLQVTDEFPDDLPNRDGYQSQAACQVGRLAVSRPPDLAGLFQAESPGAIQYLRPPVVFPVLCRGAYQSQVGCLGGSPCRVLCQVVRRRQGVFRPLDAFRCSDDCPDVNHS